MTLTEWKTNKKPQRKHRCHISILTQTKIAEVNTQNANAGEMLITTPYYLVFLNGSEVVDVNAEKARLENEIQKTDVELQKLKNIMANAGFVSHAPQAVIQKYTKQIKEYEDKINQLNASIKKL